MELGNIPRESCLVSLLGTRSSSNCQPNTGISRNYTGFNIHLRLAACKWNTTGTCFHRSRPDSVCPVVAKIFLSLHYSWTFVTWKKTACPHHEQRRKCPFSAENMHLRKVRCFTLPLHLFGAQGCCWNLEKTISLYLRAHQYGAAREVTRKATTLECVEKPGSGRTR